MADLFVLLLLITFGFLIWSIVAPVKVARLLDKQGKRQLAPKHLSTGFGFLAIVFFVLIGITAPPQTTTPTKNINLSSSKSATSTTTAPKVTTKTVTETKAVPYNATTVDDANLAKGTTKVTTQGVNGVETLTYKETFTGSKQTAKTLISDTVTTQPVTQITSVGTYVAPAPAETTTSTPSSSCYPTASSGNCYEPGEYCSDADHGMNGVAGDGKSITCAYNKGWRWEPQ